MNNGVNPKESSMFLDTGSSGAWEGIKRRDGDLNIGMFVILVEG